MDKPEHPSTLDCRISDLEDYYDLTFAQLIHLYHGESSFQTSLEDNNINLTTVDSAMTHDITHMKSKIPDNLLLDQYNESTSNIVHKETIDLRKFLENECYCTKKWTNNLIFRASLDLKT